MRYAILVDGEFLKRLLTRKLRRFPQVTDVLGEIAFVQACPEVAGESLYRILYYSADPLTGRARHPLSGETIDFSRSDTSRRNLHLTSQLELTPDVAVRRGVLAHQGWEIGPAALRRLLKREGDRILSRDLIPKIQQKGVDMRIGLDIASLALKRLVSAIVILSGDSDLAPAMKFARREGLRVYLHTLGSRHIRGELLIHADRVLHPAPEISSELGHQR